ncbi:MAG: flagellar motor protein MotB [Bacteroidota bacterium]
MKNTPTFVVIIALFAFSACNNTKIAELEGQLAEKNRQVEQLESQIEHMQSTNKGLLDRMSDLSVVNKEGAESIKESLKSINQQYSFIEDLTTKLQAKDSVNLALVMNLKQSLSDVQAQDIEVEVRGGVVYVSISDKMLFTTGSSRINEEAKEVLGSIAAVINDQPGLNILVEGHTDDVPISRKGMVDNWDLSVKRATSVVRTLQNEYYVSPERLTAAGRSEYVPKADNETEDGRGKNRRTEIIFTPRLDQFFELMEAPKMKG